MVGNDINVMKLELNGLKLAETPAQSVKGSSSWSFPVRLVC